MRVQSRTCQLGFKFEDFWVFLSCVFWVFELLLKISNLFRFLGLFWLLSVFEILFYFLLFLFFELWRLAIRSEFNFRFCVCVCASESLCDSVQLGGCRRWTRLQNAMCGIGFLIFFFGSISQKSNLFFFGGVGVGGGWAQWRPLTDNMKTFDLSFFLFLLMWYSWIWLSFRSVLAVFRKWVS